MTREEIIKSLPKSILEDIRAEIDSYCSDNRDRNDGLYIAMRIIDKHLHEIESEVGKWTRIDKDKLKCSECEVIHYIAQYPQSANINYCPNCGTKMEVEK